MVKIRGLLWEIFNYILNWTGERVENFMDTGGAPDDPLLSFQLIIIVFRGIPLSILFTCVLFTCMLYRDVMI